jgi:hypothetical protein
MVSSKLRNVNSQYYDFTVYSVFVEYGFNKPVLSCIFVLIAPSSPPRGVQLVPKKLIN